MTTQPGGRRAYPDIPIQHVELREAHCYGLGYVLDVNDNDTGEGSVVEVWIDRDVPRATPAVANIRLTPADALRFAELLICAAERIEQETALPITSKD